MKSFVILTFTAVAIVAALGAPAAAPSTGLLLPKPTTSAHNPNHRSKPSTLSAFELIAQLKKTLAEVSTALAKANSRLEALIPQSPALQKVQAIISQLEYDSNRVILKAIGQLSNAGSFEELVHIAQQAALEIKQLMFSALAEIQKVLFDGSEGDLMGQIQAIYLDLGLELRDAIKPLLDLIGGTQGSKKVTTEELLKQLAETLRLIRGAVTEAEEELESIVASSPVAQEVQSIVSKLDADASAVMERALAQMGSIGSLEEIVHILQLAAFEVKVLGYVALEEIKQVVQSGGADAESLVQQIQDVAWELTEKVREAARPLLDLIEQIQKP